MTDQAETKQITWEDFKVVEESQQEPQLRGILLVTGVTLEEFKNAFEELALESARTGEIFTHVPVIGNPEHYAFSIPPTSCEKIASLAEHEYNVEFHVYPVAVSGAPLCTVSRNPLTLHEYNARLCNGE